MNFEINFKILVLGLIAGVFSYWLNAYNETTVSGVHIYLIAGISTGIAAFILASRLKYDPKPITQNLVFGFLLAVVGRIIFDIVTLDSTSHNLAPLEIIIMFLIVSLASILGAKIGELRQ